MEKLTRQVWNDMFKIGADTSINDLAHKLDISWVAALRIQTLINEELLRQGLPLKE